MCGPGSAGSSGSAGSIGSAGRELRFHSLLGSLLRGNHHVARLPCSKWRFPQYLDFHQGPLQLLVGYKHHHVPGPQTQKGGHKPEERNNDHVRKTGLGGRHRHTSRAVPRPAEAACHSSFLRSVLALLSLLKGFWQELESEKERKLTLRQVIVWGS